MLQKEEFVVLLEKNQVPHTRHVRGSNYCFINVFPDRIPGRAIIISVVSLIIRSLSETYILAEMKYDADR